MTNRVADAELTAEDRARGEFYALLARIYADAPDVPLLGAIAAADRANDNGPMLAAWNRLIEASERVDAAAAAQEYTDLFIGVGQSEVNLHASHWLKGFMQAQPLVEVRADLAGLGVARQGSATMLEDHLSALCEAMRMLIAGHDARAPAPIATQRAFFERHIAPWAFACCASVMQSDNARYYAAVADFTTQFLTLDRDALAMDG